MLSKGLKKFKDRIFSASRKEGSLSGTDYSEGPESPGNVGANSPRKFSSIKSKNSSYGERVAPELVATSSMRSNASAAQHSTITLKEAPMLTDHASPSNGGTVLPPVQIGSSNNSFSSKAQPPALANMFSPSSGRRKSTPAALDMVLRTAEGKAAVEQLLQPGQNKLVFGNYFAGTSAAARDQAAAVAAAEKAQRAKATAAGPAGGAAAAGLVPRPPPGLPPTMPPPPHKMSSLSQVHLNDSMATVPEDVAMEDAVHTHAAPSNSKKHAADGSSVQAYPPPSPSGSTPKMQHAQPPPLQLQQHLQQHAAGPSGMLQSPHTHTPHAPPQQQQQQAYPQQHSPQTLAQATQAVANLPPPPAMSLLPPVQHQQQQAPPQQQLQQQLPPQQQVQQPQQQQPQQAQAVASPARSPQAQQAPAEEAAATQRPPASKLVSLSPQLPAAMQRKYWTLSDYNIIRKMYTGYASTVYQAMCKKSLEMVALKVYHMQNLCELNHYQVFREIRVHSSLQHQNIIHLIAAFQEGTDVVLVQEYAEGGDLYRLLHKNGGRLSERQAVEMVLHPFLLALHYLHTRGIMHRDIKPENVLFTEHRVLKLADFGLAIDLTEERAVTRAGTLDYMAPEVLRCPPKNLPQENKNNPYLHYNNSVDAWAVGVFAYELIVGFPPFAGETQLDSVDRIMHSVPEFPAKISEFAKDFICQCLRKHPGDRPTVMELLHHPWVRTFQRRTSMRITAMPRRRSSIVYNPGSLAHAPGAAHDTYTPPQEAAEEGTDGAVPMETDVGDMSEMTPEEIEHMITKLQVAKAQAIAKSESHRSPGQEVLMQQVQPLRI
ncbi:hypothetical protein HXX76_006505 [Chlamydomonas incerta]|uniref:Protein kinase domain-containing protein n=1 Tax=Chlamydomonas incerta TaxID=51695 RepID=A0A835SZR8_CHLIN|nr:hypothetical protein HXX76_006505 [Chlamydomonas incerta]|eukprot:KAG2436193.1 hypothetical protein HXX76_006505 [Chlamydomonas incerta]